MQDQDGKKINITNSGFLNLLVQSCNQKGLNLLIHPSTAIYVKFIMTEDICTDVFIFNLPISAWGQPIEVCLQNQNGYNQNSRTNRSLLNIGKERLKSSFH